MNDFIRRNWRWLLLALVALAKAADYASKTGGG